jgi:hypothetical protein
MQPCRLCPIPNALAGNLCSNVSLSLWYTLMADGQFGLWRWLRLMECVRLRVKDIDFLYHHITVRQG